MIDSNKGEPAFLSGKIGFLDIIDIVEKTISTMQYRQLDSIEQVLGTIAEAKEVASLAIDRGIKKASFTG